MPKPDRLGERLNCVGGRRVEEAEHNCERQRAHDRRYVDGLRLVHGHLLDAGAVVGDSCDAGTGADAFAAEGVGGRLRNLAVAVLGIVKGPVQVARFVFGSPEGFEEKRLQVEPFQAVAGHAGGEAVGVGAPQLLGVVQQKQVCKRGAVALEGHFPKVVGVLREAGDRQLLPRNLREEGEGELAQQVVRGQGKVDATAAPADLAGGVHAAEVVAQESLHVGGYRVVLVVEAVGPGVVAEGTEAKGAGVSPDCICRFEELYGEAPPPCVQPGGEPGRSGPEHSDRRVGGVSGRRHRQSLWATCD